MTMDEHAPAGAVTTVAELADRHGLALQRFAYLLCGNLQVAEDLLQDVLLALHRRFPDELALDNPVGYVRRALANVNVSRLRRRATHELATDTLPDTAVASATDGAAERDALFQAMRQLPVRQRSALVLRYYADATDAEIADALGCRPGTVRSLLSRGLAALRTDAAFTSEGEIR